MAEDAAESAAIKLVGIESDIVRGKWFSKPLHVVLHEELNNFAADAATALERFPNAAARGHVRAELHYRASGFDISAAMRARRRPAAPPSSTRWSKLRVRLASVMGTNCCFFSSQKGALRPAPMPSTRVCSGSGMGVAQVRPKVPKFVMVAIDPPVAPGGSLRARASSTNSL